MEIIRIQFQTLTVPIEEGQSYRIEILNASGCETIGDLLGCDHNTNGMTISEWFRHSHNIGNDIMLLESPKMGSNTPQANLNLISNNNATSLTNSPAKNKAKRIINWS